ncbi:MAG: hypothetical protein RL337_1387 [Bacteroidota bacterium]|jgi:hypothetical protein
MKNKGNIFKAFYLQITLLLCAVLCSVSLGAQSTELTIKMPPIPTIRQLSHDYILNSEQDLIKHPSIAKDTIVTQCIHLQVFENRNWIETNNALPDNEKFKWLRGVNNLLIELHTGLKLNQLTVAAVVSAMRAFTSAMQLSARGLNISPLITNENSTVGSILLATGSFTDNIGYAAARDQLILKNCQNFPDQILNILDKQGSEISSNRYADSLLIAAAFNNPEMVYNYAAAPSALGKKIQSINHPLVRWIGRLAYMKTGRYYFPFLDELYTGKINIDNITPLIPEDQTENYFKLLVETRIKQVQRKKEGKTLVAEAALLTKLKSIVMDLYVNDINGLHQTQSSIVRFKKIANLTPQELYYIAVLGADELYTSSFVSGIYPLIIRKLGTKNTSELLALVYQDYFKKFIALAANYNTLQNFLSHMPIEASNDLMRRFVRDLDIAPTLEDAVDVADAFSSISDTSLQDLILSEIRKNKNNRLYQTLDALCTAAIHQKNTNPTIQALQNTFGLLDFNTLRNNQKNVIVRQYFYGDKDGIQIFNAFINSFNKPGWKTIQKKYWTEINSTNGKVSIYANMPLDEKNELDLKAQDSLTGYLAAQKITPSIVIHRGHSYYANHTIASIDSSAKLVLLGSCGGYQKLTSVLKRAPNTQIIASKQIGKGVINAALLSQIAEALEKGQDLIWSGIWKQMNDRLKGEAKTSFQDYIPPYKNIGLMLLKTYSVK